MTHDPSKTPEPQPQASEHDASAASSSESSEPISGDPTSGSPTDAEQENQAEQAEQPTSEQEETAPVSPPTTETTGVEVTGAKATEAESAITADRVEASPEASKSGESGKPGEPGTPPTTKPHAQPEASPTPSSSPPPQPSTKTQAFLQAMRRLSGVLGTIWVALTPILLGMARGIWQLTLSLLKGIRDGWKAALPRIKRLLPEGWNNLPDWFLTTLALLLLVFVAWITIVLLPSPAPSIEEPPPAISQPEPAIPEPALIDEIQTQVAEVTDQYAEGLIQSVQANFRLNQLTVQLGDGWYELATNQQDQLASELLRRSRKLEFDNLEMTNTEGDLLARNPVVGSQMVIYDR